MTPVPRRHGAETCWLLRGVRVGSGGEVADVRVADGRVAAVGPGLSEPRDRSWHQPGAVLLPGFVDAHLHATQWASSRMRIDVSAARSPEQAAELVRRAVAVRPHATPRDEWVVGHGFRDALWDHPPHGDVLERVLPGRPVALVSHDLHTVWLSPAASAGGGGANLAGHLSAHPTGVLREGDAMQAAAAVDAGHPPEQLDRWVGRALGTAAARGITAVTDFEFADNHARWVRRAEHGDIPVRVRAAVWQPWLDEALDRGLRTGDLVPGGRGRVETGPFKVIADGALNTRTAFCHDPYPEVADADQAHGMLLVAEEELAALMARASSAGLQPAVHAIGDAANAVALRCFERVGCAGSIEHAQLVRPEDVRRFARAGLVTSIQPQHVVADREVADRHWPGRTAWAYPYASLLAAGARLALGSDAPVAEPLPLQALADAVLRTDDDRSPWHPEQSLALADALPAACGGRREVAVGDPADLVLLGADPAEVAPRDLPHIPVLATMLAGRFTHGGVG